MTVLGDLGGQVRVGVTKKRAEARWAKELEGMGIGSVATSGGRR